MKNAEKTEKAFKAFYAFHKDAPDRQLQLHRNRIQERILAASNQRCNEFKQVVKRLDSAATFSLGTLTTILAGAGAIVTPVSAVRALAGSAGIASGIRAEFIQSYFSNKTVEVIVKALDSRREDLFKKIEERQAHPIEKYTVEAAVKDALEYHGACSLIVGLEQIADTIVKVRDPGLQTLSDVFPKALDLRRTVIASVSGLGPQLREVDRFLDVVQREIGLLEDEITGAHEIEKEAEKQIAEKKLDRRTVQTELESLKKGIKDANDKLVDTRATLLGSAAKLREATNADEISRLVVPLKTAKKDAETARRCAPSFRQLSAPQLPNLLQRHQRNHFRKPSVRISGYGSSPLALMR